MKMHERLGLSPQQRLFVAAFDGDSDATAKRIGITSSLAHTWAKASWFMSALHARGEREAKRVTEQQAEALRKAVADRMEVQAFWTAIMRGQQVPICDPDTGLPALDDKGVPTYTAEPATRDRIAAAKHLADSLGMATGTETVIVRDGAPLVRQAEIDERITKLTGKIPSRIMAHVPTSEWLQ